MFKKILIGIVVAAALGGVGFYIATHKTIAFESVCDSTNTKYHEEYCKNVGKSAYTLASMASINEKNFGKIIGVAWRSKGSTVSAPGQQKRTSTRNAYYYIVQQEGGDYAFLRLVSETEAR